MAPSTASNNGSESGNNSANNNNNSTNSTTTAIPQPQQPIIQQQKQQQQQSQDKLEEWSQKLADFYHHGITKESLKRHQVPLAIAVLSIVLTGNSGIVYSGILYPLYWLVLRIIAIAVGTAVGLGFATHVYDQLEHWTQQQQQQRREREANSVIAGSNSKLLRRDTAALLQERASGSLVGGAAAASSGKQYTKVAPTGHHQHHLHQVLQHDDASSYAALMASAGYEVDPNWKRGQVVHQRDPLEPKYPFCDTPVEKQYAIQVMQQEWPTLPSVVQMQLGRFMEFIMRDYVSTWYSMIDYSGGIPYPWCVQNAKDKVACLERGDPWIEPIPPSPPTPPHGDLFPRRMVFSTASTRPLPLLEQMYRSIAVILGNLSHRVQDVNVFQLVLLKWIKVVAHTFKVYRQLRKALLEKQNVHKLALFEEARGGMGHAGRAIIRRAVNTVKNNTGNSGSGSGSGNGTNDPTAAPSNPSLTPTSTTTTAATTTADDSDTAGSESDTAAAATATDETNTNTTTTTTTDRFSGYQPVSEMTITKEFLVTGKLHPACTFGLDIPSLLFADPNGRDCGTGQPGQDPKTFATKRDHMNEDRVLAERLFETNLLKECELDYNRVVASRMIKLLIPRADFGSPILAALLTEIMAGSVLTPVMSVFSPDYLNDWIAKGMDESGSEEQQDGDDTEEGSVEKKKEESKEDGKQESSTSKAPQPQSVMRTWTEEDEGQLNDEDSNRSRNNAVIPSTTRIRSFSEEGEMVLEDNLDEEGRQELGELMDLSDNKDMDLSAYHREAAEDMLGAGASDVAAVGETTTAGSSHGDALAEEDDDADDDDILLEGSTNAAGVSPMITLLHMSLMNLQRHVDMEEARQRGNTGDSKIDWDDKVCQAAVLRLVLVMEALLFHGRRKYPERAPVFSRGTSEAGTSSNASDAGSESNAEPGDEEPPAVKEEFNTTNMTQILMDLTSDIEAFEKMHVKPQDEMVGSNDNKYDDDNAGDVEEEGEGKSSDNDFVPTANDISTLRTLIAAWLHTGQIYRTISTLVKARTTVLKPYYHSYAFLRKPSSASALTDQLKMLDRIDIMVDTVSILNAPRIDLDEEIKLLLEGVDPQEITDSTHSVRDREADSKVVESTSAPMKRGQRFMGLLDKSKKALNEQRKAVAGKAGNIVKKNSLNRSTTTSEPSEVPVPAPDIPAASTPRKEVSAPATYPSPTASNSTSPVTMAQMQQQFAVPGGTPRYLDYHRNEAFASSLRSERDRRMQSWISAIHNDTELVQVVCRMIGCTPEDVAYHRELHHVARIFYAGTNLVGIRDAARSSSNRQRSRLNSAGSTQSVTSAMSEQSTSETQSPEVSLLTVEMACSRRKIEVPDDDSSFLLRAQPRPLNAIGVHRDTHNADQSYRCFQGSYEEPAILPGTNNYRGGRFVRRCLIRYYPSDRTASVVLQNDGRKLDQRKGKSIVPDMIKLHQPAVPFLSQEFLKARHLCEKWIPSGSASRSQPGMLSSNIMEQSDFTAAPRTGKALDFVYRMSLFESPMVILDGKRFKIHDSSAQGAHRADASSLEMSDAALSAALHVIGRDYTDASASDGQGDANSVNTGHSGSVFRNKVELGPDGYPIIWMKYTRKQDDSSTATEIKPYRVSFVRAALLVTSTRQEAQLQCLIKCVKAGSAKSATKARTDAQLRPTLRLLEFARDPRREKQSVLMRDLKLGINHIDREQLRRNALLSPRYPTLIRDIQISIEKAMPARDASVKISGNPQSTVYKIRCVATVDLVDEDIYDESLQPFLTPDGRLGTAYKETWVIYRPFRDFQTLHKHLKSQVANTETSGTAGSRLVGAATAAFTAGGSLVASNQASRSRQRKALIPSLGQAQKAGALGVTQRTIAKRMEILDGYLRHLLSPGHHLSRSSELLMFIGAYFPLAPEVRVGKMPIMTVNDPLGRTEMSREVLKFAPPPTSTPAEQSFEAAKFEPKQSTKRDLKASFDSRKMKTAVRDDAPGIDTLVEDTEGKASKPEKIKMNPAIETKIDKVPLGKVRSRIFELLGYQFGFENASFLRSRMLSALKTASFAVTTPGEFKRKLYMAHIKHVSPEAIAKWINFGIETLWPDGVSFESKPPLTPEQQKAAADKSRGLLHAGFPDQLRAVLGQDLTRDGLDVLHEMLQNRMVVKSMFYMLFDLLWQDVFPEIKDVLSCGESLDISFEEEGT